MLGAAALSGATLVGINPTRRGAELARDIAAHRLRVPAHRTAHLELLDGAGDVVPPTRLFVVDDPRVERRARARTRARRCPTSRSSPARPVHADLHVGHDRRAEGRAHGPRPPGRLRRDGSPRTSRSAPADVCYSLDAAVPLQRAGRRATPPVVASGATTVLRRRFSASGVPARRAQLRRHVLQLRRQAAHLHPRHAGAARRRRQPAELRRSATRPRRSTSTGSRQRFGCFVVDGYGSTEGGVNMSRTPTTRRRARSACPSRASTRAIVDPETGEECPPRDVRRARPAAQRRGGDRRDRQPRRRGRLRGLLQQPRGERASACATAGTGPATSATATTTASSTSPAATPTGCASTARTSPPRRSST